MSEATALCVRRFAERDFDELVTQWHETNLVSYRYVAEHQRHTLQDARRFFRDKVLPSCAVLVAERTGTLVGLIALEMPWIRQFAVFPAYQRRGIGTALLHEARERSPHELRLFTFQRNDAARAFYEKHGFKIIKLGMSPAPELEPDIEYRWVA